jgi:hypothetical protein
MALSEVSKPYRSTKQNKNLPVGECLLVKASKALVEFKQQAEKQLCLTNLGGVRQSYLQNLLIFTGVPDLWR